MPTRHAVGPEGLYSSIGWSYHKVLSENMQSVFPITLYDLVV